MAVGGIAGMDHAPALVAAGRADLCAIARGFLAGAVLAPGERVAVAGVGVAVEGYAAGFNAPPVELAGEGQGLLLRLEALP